MDEIITLDYGSGGRKTSALIDRIILPAMDNPFLAELGDGAVLEGAEQLVFSTDSFVVDPLFFPGGNIGKLAVCGTVNDIAVCGGSPKFLSCALIIEEGFRTEDLNRIISSMAETAAAAGVKIVTGDTKVVEKGRGDGLFINTSGIGFLKHPGLSRQSIRQGDAVIVSGTVGDHGTAVMLSRSGMLGGELCSDCADLSRLADAILSADTAAGVERSIRILRDPTRGGVATTLNEFVEGTGLCIELDERDIPVRDSVNAACGILGLDPLYCANEGKLLCICAAEAAEHVLNIMHGTEEGKNAAVIGRVSDRYPGGVVMKTAAGGSRILRKLTGAQLPRIC